MKELDFDELDRAVNSLMNKKDAAKKPTPKPTTERTVDLATSSTESVQKSPAEPTPQVAAPRPQSTTEPVGPETATERAPSARPITETSSNETESSMHHSDGIKIFEPQPKSEPTSSSSDTARDMPPRMQYADTPSKSVRTDSDKDTSMAPASRTSFGAGAIHTQQRAQPPAIDRPSRPQTIAQSDETAGPSQPLSSPATDVASSTPTEPATASTDSSSKPSPVIPHRTGRFMDMKPAKSAKDAPLAPSKRPSRHGKVLQPSGNAPVLDVVKPASTSTPPVSSANEPSATTSTPSDDKPTTDLTDFEALLARQQPEREESLVDHDDSSKPDTPMPVAAADELPDVEDMSVEVEPATPVAEPVDFSAFLTDVKPEKRPLGGGAPQTEAAGDVTDNAAGGIDAAEPKIDQHQDLPSPSEEFNKRLLDIESGNDEKMLPSGHVDEAESTVDVEPSVPVQSAPKPAETTPVRPVGPASISRQYDEQPSSGPDSNGAIFDTATYHKPLEHPERASHGWIWVLLIFLVIVLGAGIGAALYLGYL